MNKILSINKPSFRRYRRVIALTLRDPQKTEAAWPALKALSNVEGSVAEGLS